MAARDWRRAADYADLDSLDLSSLAWEFLRRNPAYQSEQAGRDMAAAAGTAGRTLSARWGLRFAVSPLLSANQGPVFWRADAAPAHVLILTASDARGVTGGELAGRTTARRRAEDGLHLRLDHGLQVVIPDGIGLRVPLAAAAPLDADLAIRLSALDALERLLEDKPGAPDPLPALTRRRVGLMLRTLDGRALGASYRDIAEDILEAAPDPQAWRTSTTRDVAIRLCRAARLLMGGGYLGLLRRRR